jgi:hypothetical protein
MQQLSTLGTANVLILGVNLKFSEPDWNSEFESMPSVTTNYRLHHKADSEACRRPEGQ